MNIFKKELKKEYIEEQTLFSKVENRVLSYIRQKSYQIIREDIFDMFKNISKFFLGVFICIVGITGAINHDFLSFKEYLYISLGLSMFLGIGIIDLIKTEYYPIYKIVKKIKHINDKHYNSFIRLIWITPDERIDRNILLLTEEETKEVLKLNLTDIQLNFLKSEIETNGQLNVDSLIEIKRIIKIEQEQEENKEAQNQKELEKKENLLMFFEKYNITNTHQLKIKSQKIELDLNDTKFKNLL